MPIQITVRGRYELLLPPERCTVHAELALEGSDPAALQQTLARSVQEVHASLGALHDQREGPVTWWSADRLRTWSHRPFHDQGTQLPLVHHARAGLSAKFSGFEALGGWLAQTAALPGFAVLRLEWTLTQARRATLVREARQGAVRDALRRAQDYADALDLGEVRPVDLADAGMLGEGLHPAATDQVAFSRAAATGGGEVRLVPQDVEVAAAVDARFSAG